MSTETLEPAEVSVAEVSVAEVHGARRRARTGVLLALPGTVYLVLFFAIPVFSLLATSLYEPIPGGDLGDYQPALRFENYTDALFGAGGYWRTLVRSFVYAMIATVAALLIAYPTAYLIAVRLRGRHLLQSVLLVCLVAPFFTSFILRTVAWKQILADDSVVVSSLKFVHLLPEDSRLTATSFAVVAGLTYNFLPFMALPIFASLERLDLRLIEAGSDLYASAFTIFRKITLPLSLPGVVAGTLLTFIPATGDYVNASLLGNPGTTMIGQVIDARFFSVLDYPTASALSFTLMAIILVIVTVYVRKAGTKDLL